MRLYTPGPVPVHPDVLAAAAQHPLHHRSPEFVQLSARVWSRLAEVFRTDGTVTLLPGSGMTGIEAALSSVHGRGSTVVVFSHGRFGDRLRVIAERYGLSVIYRSVEWGETITPPMVQDTLGDHRYADGVWLVHAETSTGVALDLPSITSIIRRMAPEALIGVDVVTSLGVQPFHMDEWQLDVAVAGLQKGLACLPGMAAVALSDRAQRVLKTVDPTTYTLDLQRILDSQQKGLFTWTPPVTLVAALDASLKRLLSVEPDVWWTEHRARHAEIVSLCSSHDVPLFGNASAMGVVAIAHERSDAVRQHLREEYGIQVAGGQDQLAGMIFRVGTMGYHTDDDVSYLLDALASSFREFA